MGKAKKKFAAEIGGTFTDIILFEDIDGESKLKTLKVPSTPQKPEDAVIAGADKLLPDWTNTTEMLHGSTVATNAVLERKGVKTALILTQGFADTLEIARGDKENIYDLFYQRPEPVVPRDLIFTVNERLTSDGDVLIPLDEGEIYKIARVLKEKGVSSVGVCFLHSYINSTHESIVKEILEKELPDCIITASYEILPQFREYERTSTLAITSYIAPVMVRYIETLYEELQNRGFEGGVFITQSNGGVIPMESLRKEVARTLLSGPAAGVTGAIFMANQSGFEDIITLDMGGTSADVCLINKGNPLITTDNKLDGSAIAVPMLDIATIGAGGGSIAWVDTGGMLRVGPQSSGANPGPACYGKGGKQATMTDSLVYRGMIRPDYFAGGNYKIDRDLSKKVINELSEVLDTTPDEMAEAIGDIMIANTVQAVQLVSTQRGYDARNYTLVAYGGAGPMIGGLVADEIGIKKVLIPPHAGILSSFGLLVADIIRDYVQTNVSLCTDITDKDISSQFNKLESTATNEMVGYGFKKDTISFQYSLDARYHGQAFELQLDFDHIPKNPQEISDAFHDAHQKRYGFNAPDTTVEIVNYRLKTIIPQNNDLLTNINYDSHTEEDEYTLDNILIAGSWRECKFYSWDKLRLDSVIEGPAIIEDSTSTCYVPINWTLSLQSNGSMILERKDD